jgi:hypothetical protein
LFDANGNQIYSAMTGESQPNDGKTYELSVRLPSGSWTIHVHFAGSAGWLTGTLSVRVHIC